MVNWAVGPTNYVVSQSVPFILSPFDVCFVVILRVQDCAPYGQ